MHCLNWAHGGYGFPISVWRGQLTPPRMCRGVTPFSANTKQRYWGGKEPLAKLLAFFLPGGLFKIAVISDDVQWHKQPSLFFIFLFWQSSIRLNNLFPPCDSSFFFLLLPFFYVSCFLGIAHPNKLFECKHLHSSLFSAKLRLRTRSRPSGWVFGVGLSAWVNAISLLLLLVNRTPHR